MMELMALKDIIFETSGGRPNSEGTGKNKRASGLRGLSLAQQFSKLHYEDSEKSFTSDEIFSIKQFTLEIVTFRLEDIRECFDAEKIEIEQEIDRLNNTLDGDYGADESDSNVAKSMSKLSILTGAASPSPVPAERTELCSVCSTKRPYHQLQQAANRGSSSSFICTACETTRNKREAKMGTISALSSAHRGSNNTGSNNGLSHSQSTPANLTSPQLVERDHLSSPPDRVVHRNNNEESPDGAGAKSSGRRGPVTGSSKFRNRIDSARFDHHFSDAF